MQAFVIGDKDKSKVNALNEYMLKDTMAADSNFLTYSDARKKRIEDTLKIGIFNDNYLSGTIAVAQDKMMYLSIPFDIGWQTRWDWKESA